MMTVNQVILAIQNVSAFCNVKENLLLFTKVVIAVESGHLKLDELKLKLKDSSSKNGSTLALFNVILLEHDNIKALYLIKGLAVLMSEISPKDLPKYEIELVYNLHRTAEDSGVYGELVKVLQEVHVFPRYKSIITHI